MQKSAVREVSTSSCPPPEDVFGHGDSWAWSKKGLHGVTGGRLERRRAARSAGVIVESDRRPEVWVSRLRLRNVRHRSCQEGRASCLLTCPPECVSCLVSVCWGGGLLSRAAAVTGVGYVHEAVWEGGNHGLEVGVDRYREIRFGGVEDTLGFAAFAEDETL